MSKTLWNTIKLEVPKEMVNITKKDKVVVKKSLTKTNNVSKANKEPSIKIIPGDTNKPKIISDGKEWNVEELKIKMKRAKELGKKNEGKEYKKDMTKDKAAKVITKEINSRAQLNKADKYLQTKKEKEEFIEKIKSYSRNELEIIIKKIIGYKNNIDYFDRTNNSGGANHTLSLNEFAKEQLIRQIQKFKESYRPHHYNKTIPAYLFIPEIPKEMKMDLSGGGSKRELARRNIPI